MSTPRAPLRIPRLASLFMAFAFGVIGGSVGVNALAKYFDQKHALQHAAPAGATVNIDASDIVSVGYVLTVVCGLIALAALLFFPATLRASAFASRVLGLQTAVFAFLSVWCFACLVPFTDFFATRQAKVTAFLGTLQLPDSLVQQIQQQLGATPIYRDVQYLRLPAVICWFTLLFSVIATVVSFLAMRRARHFQAAPPYPTGSSAYTASESERDVVNEKEAEKEKDVVANGKTIPEV